MLSGSATCRHATRTGLLENSPASLHWLTWLKVIQELYRCGWSSRTVVVRTVVRLILCSLRSPSTGWPSSLGFWMRTGRCVRAAP
jgi:hypothetical protein